MENEQKPIEIKDLNKTQLILLSILLSFVVSIATGIMTVSLLQQAPPAVTQTINRVVEQTIEKAVPDYSAGKVQTVVVKEDDLVVDAVSKTKANFFVVQTASDTATKITDAFSLGNGIFLVDSTKIDSSLNYLINDNGKFMNVKVTDNLSKGVSILSANPSDPLISDFAKPNTLANGDIKVGQTAILVSSDFIEKQLIQNIYKDNTKNIAGQIIENWNVVGVEGISLSRFVGDPVVSLDGNVLGIVLDMPNADEGVKDQIVAIDDVNKIISNITQKTNMTTSSSTTVQ